MENFHIIQKITLSLFTFVSIASLIYSLYVRRELTLGTFETSLAPLIAFYLLVFRLKYFSTNHIAILSIGLFIYIIGCLLAEWAFWHLGFTNSDDFWLARKEIKERTLVTAGPYVYIRHPLFVGLALQMAGLVLVFLHPITFGLLLVALVYGIYTSISEEKFMISRFPQYAQYVKLTGRFFPKLIK